MDRAKRFVRPVKLINLILMLICIIGFTYQVYLIFNQYMLGKTVVNLEVKILKDQPLPAITICIQAQISLIKVYESSKYRGQFDELLNNYKKLLNQSRPVNETTWQLFKFHLKYIYTKISYEIEKNVASFNERSELSIT